jgi:exodeoxyribonuclease III
VTLSVATWNVNGIRARESQVREWLERDRPDVVCLQEIKASPAQVPAALFEMLPYWNCWHGERAYSGVSLHVRKDAFPQRPVFGHPDFDYENRIVTADLPGVTVASVYVPNGGKDFPAKMRFLEALEREAGRREREGSAFVLGGDINVARSDQDVHPKERKATAIGQLPEERAMLERILAGGLVDVARALDPQNAELFTWWAPWRNLRQRNIGWRIDYILASAPLAARASACRVLAAYGTSDHAPVVAVFDTPGPPPGNPAPSPP